MTPTDGGVRAGDRDKHVDRAPPLSAPGGSLHPVGCKTFRRAHRVRALAHCGVSGAGMGSQAQRENLPRHRTQLRSWGPTPSKSH